MRTSLVGFLTCGLVALFLSNGMSGQELRRYATYSDVEAVLQQFHDDVPLAVRPVPGLRLDRAWASWIEQHDGAIRARLAQGDQDTILNWLMFGTTFTAQPRALAAVKALARLAPELPQVGCFDTAFHRGMPWTSRWFALPRALTEEGIERYGFHGLSYDYVAGELARRRPLVAAGRVVVAHLGHGASLCALHDGASVATTMGFGVTDGLMMGRRCGALDPGVILHLLRAKGMDADAVAELINKRSGLLGVSGISDDVRTLEASGDAHAEEALELFAERAAEGIAQMAAALRGLDAIVFTGGIGERSAAMRERIAGRCRWLGAELDAEANRAHDFALHASGSRVALFTLPTDEEAVVAREVWRLHPPAADAPA